jgi:uncharacterized pyridoxamine 5'-phosphate oxidase family protein
MNNTKDLKKQIRQLRKLKLQCKSGSPDRIRIHRQIKALKDQLAGQINVDKEKEPLIKEILEYEKIEMFDKVYYNRFSVEQLKFHLEKIKSRRKE